MKKVLYGLIGVLSLYLVLAFIGPAKIDVVREVSVNKSASLIMPKLGDFKFFNEKWNPWMELDPDMKITYKGEAGKVGHINEWAGNKKVGDGTMEITYISKDTVIEKMTFGGHDGGTVYLIAMATGDSTRVSWQMKSDVAFFARPFMLFMNMEKKIGEMYDKGLPKLKKAIEEIQGEAISNYEVMEQSWEEKTYVGKRAVVSTENNMEKLSAFFMENYPKLYEGLGKSKVQPLGPPSAIFFKWEEKQTDVAAVATVANGTKIKDWETWTVPPSKVLTVTYFGPDGGSIEAHNSIGKYMKEKQLEQQFVIEEYVTDRAIEKDSTKWQTNIFYVLK